jgi:hypothetical protein
VFFATPVMRTVARIELPLYQGGDDGDSLPGLQYVGHGSILPDRSSTVKGFAGTKARWYLVGLSWIGVAGVDR